MSCFLTHRFDKWKEIERNDIIRGYDWVDRDKWRKVGIAILMERQCEKCGEKQIKTIEHVSP